MALVAVYLDKSQSEGVVGEVMVHIKDSMEGRVVVDGMAEMVEMVFLVREQMVGVRLDM